MKGRKADSVTTNCYRFPTWVKFNPLSLRFLELEDIKNEVVEFQAAAFDQLKHGLGREGLGDAGDAEQRVGLHDLIGLTIGVSEAARVDKSAKSGDGQRGAGQFALGQEIRHQAVKTRQPPIDAAHCRHTGRLGRERRRQQ
jgi:hypothetical protein